MTNKRETDTIKKEKVGGDAQMTPIINFTDPITLILTLALFVLVAYLGKECKKSFIPGIMLGVFLILLIGHAIEFSFVNSINQELLVMIGKCLFTDFIFILLSFFMFLWIDDIEAKSGKKESIDNSLEWFWKKV